MDVLPPELVNAILDQCVALGPRNCVLELRLVCRLFDKYLKPKACQTITLEFSRLSAASGRRRPRPDALQTIGYHSKAMYIDLTLLRDEFEVEFLSTLFEKIPSMASFIHTLQQRYSMCETSFTEVDFRQSVDDVLFNCRGIERLRLDLPFQFVDQRCNAATMILANTLSAVADRLAEEDAIPLRTFVLENVSDPTLDSLWLNPIDVFNIMRVFLHLENLVVTIRRPRDTSHLWHLIRHAEHLRTLCLIGSDDDRRPPRGLRQTRAWHVSLREWQARTLPEPLAFIRDGKTLPMLPHLTCLELKRLELGADVLPAAARLFGSTLRELYLNEVYLKVEQGRHINADSTQYLWVGLPNKRPEPESVWIAILVRYYCRNLAVCRASFLGYDQLIRDDVLITHVGPNGNFVNQPFQSPEFDFLDPCGLGRSVAQRFVEVVMGYEQPCTPPPNREPVVYLLPDPVDPDGPDGPVPHDDPLPPLQEEAAPRSRPAAFRVTDYDTNAYQLTVDNPTSRWQRSLDGFFQVSNAGTLEELHYIAETASQGMQEMHRMRDQQDREGDDGVWAEDVLRLELGDEQQHHHHHHDYHPPQQGDLP